MTNDSPDGSESRPYRRRRALPHEPPLFIDTTKETFFVTIACRHRGPNQLCHPGVAKILFDAALFYQMKQQWFLHLMVLMHDHLHFLVGFALDTKMTNVVRAWKRYTSTHSQVQWQRDFFDHRLRREESFTEKAEYILQNPVRAGLVHHVDDWPYVLVFDPYGRDVSPRRPLG